MEKVVSMTLEIRPLSEALGAEVIGVDLSKPIDEATFAEIHQAFLESLVLLFRGQQAMTVEQQMTFSRRFGRLKTDLKAETMLEDHPEILVLSNLKKDGEYVGTPHRGGFWHTDLYFERIPSAAALLHALIVPEGEDTRLGDTLFANMRAAYEALPVDTKRQINDLQNRVSRVKSWPINHPHLPPLSPAQVAAYPDVIQPLVRTHPETGRKSLFIGDISAGAIEGMAEAESDALLRQLRDFATQPAFVYRHRWRVGDAVMWDDRATLHSATDFDSDKYIRHMHRTTIMDDVVPS
jgi:alpha-ketoglutarate-dependent taurine dioxygenase